MEPEKTEIIIKLQPWEAEKLDIALKHLLKTHLECPEHLLHLENDSLMAVSWLIAWRHHIFGGKGNAPTKITEYL